MNVYRLCMTAACLAATLNLAGCAGAIFAGSAASAASVATDRRTAGTILEDQAIEFRIANSIQQDADLSKKANISTTSYNMVVLLTGEAPTAEMKNRAVDIARYAEKVKRVHDEIRVAQPLPLTKRNHDGWLTAKVKTKLVGAETVSANRVKVVTSNSVVYLMGVVTRAEADAAARVASQVEGVQRVVTVFEYVEDAST